MKLEEIRTALRGMPKSEKFRFIDDQYDKWEKVTGRPRRLKITQIYTLPELFQQRDMQENLLQRDSHIAGLARVVKAGHDLDPILIFPLGGSYVCLDGHHRIEAYKLAGKVDPVPVEVFEGSFRDAWAQSIEANIKDKLPMSLEEKMEASWTMYLTEGYTWAEIMAKTKISKRTLARMSEAKKLLEGNKINVANMSWAHVKDYLKGLRDFHDDDWAEREMKKIAEKLAKHFGPDIGKHPELFAGGLYRYSPQASVRVQEELRSECGLDDPFDDLGEEF